MPIKPSKALLQVFEDECNHSEIPLLVVSEEFQNAIR